MVKACENFLFGLFFGCGFLCAYAVLKLLGYLIGQAGHGPALL